ncbi:aldehyde dehydrogenase family protein [Pseudomonas taiwanensis]|uniref:aldehyde dehydrogenase (NAD(+)) n=1 Tax=Pseudomonas taiwanensis TaxID=470150 RepID=A0ABR6V606_9PSED|nr:aldehyde dehydrogenase family protein [Pseudomonas taiwanensis]MBC3475827.1 aldehyde dehydrogenase family protein [Pseudomonas taiwanensis]
MDNSLSFYIDGEWVTPADRQRLKVENPATEETVGEISLGNAQDVDLAVHAARRAFQTFSKTSPSDRLALLQRILEVYDSRLNQLGETMSQEMGAPLPFAVQWQAGIGSRHLQQIIKTLEQFSFVQVREAGLRVSKEPIGVVGMITPWNWPMNQILCKVAPAIAAGCTMVLKPSELAPLNAILFAEIMDEAGVPPGVFNLVNGDGVTVGGAISQHPGIDMVSFTGSTQAGILVAKSAADTIKRVHQELGGKSANILLPDANLEDAVSKGVFACFSNAGQSCNAPTRMLVPAALHDKAVGIAAATASKIRTGLPTEDGIDIGPVISRQQFEKIQASIQKGIDEGADLIAGGVGRPEDLMRGHFVRPTIFANVKPWMTISKEEIFGPVLAIIPYESEADAIALANDTVYGLAAYVQGADREALARVAGSLEAGTVYINYPAWNPAAPFGGFKQSGNGREYAEFGLEEFLEVKGIVGY